MTKNNYRSKKNARRIRYAKSGIAGAQGIQGAEGSKGVESGIKGNKSGEWHNGFWYQYDEETGRKVHWVPTGGGKAVPRYLDEVLEEERKAQEQGVAAANYGVDQEKWNKANEAIRRLEQKGVDITKITENPATHTYSIQWTDGKNGAGNEGLSIDGVLQYIHGLDKRFSTKETAAAEKSEKPETQTRPRVDESQEKEKAESNQDEKEPEPIKLTSRGDWTPQKDTPSADDVALCRRVANNLNHGWADALRKIASVQDNKKRRALFERAVNNAFDIYRRAFVCHGDGDALAEMIGREVEANEQGARKVLDNYLTLYDIGPREMLKYAPGLENLYNAHKDDDFSEGLENYNEPGDEEIRESEPTNETPEDAARSFIQDESNAPDETQTEPQSADDRQITIDGITDSIKAFKKKAASLRGRAGDLNRLVESKEKYKEDAALQKQFAEKLIKQADDLEKKIDDAVAQLSTEETEREEADSQGINESAEGETSPGEDAARAISRSVAQNDEDDDWQGELGGDWEDVEPDLPEPSNETNENLNEEIENESSETTEPQAGTEELEEESASGEEPRAELESGADNEEIADETANGDGRTEADLEGEQEAEDVADDGMTPEDAAREIGAMADENQEDEDNSSEIDYDNIDRCVYRTRILSGRYTSGPNEKKYEHTQDLLKRLEKARDIIKENQYEPGGYTYALEMSRVLYGFTPSKGLARNTEYRSVLNAIRDEVKLSPDKINEAWEHFVERGINTAWFVRQVATAAFGDKFARCDHQIAFGKHKDEFVPEYYEAVGLISTLIEKSDKFRSAFTDYINALNRPSFSYEKDSQSAKENATYAMAENLGRIAAKFINGDISKLTDNEWQKKADALEESWGKENSEVREKNSARYNALLEQFSDPEIVEQLKPLTHGEAESIYDDEGELLYQPLGGGRCKMTYIFDDGTTTTFIGRQDWFDDDFHGNVSDAIHEQLEEDKDFEESLNGKEWEKLTDYAHKYAETDWNAANALKRINDGRLTRESLTEKAKKSWLEEKLHGMEGDGWEYKESEEEDDDDEEELDDTESQIEETQNVDEDDQEAIDVRPDASTPEETAMSVGQEAEDVATEVEPDAATPEEAAMSVGQEADVLPAETSQDTDTADIERQIKQAEANAQQCEDLAEFNREQGFPTDYVEKKAKDWRQKAEELRSQLNGDENAEDVATEEAQDSTATNDLTQGKLDAADHNEGPSQEIDDETAANEPIEQKDKRERLISVKKEREKLQNKLKRAKTDDEKAKIETQIRDALEKEYQLEDELGETTTQDALNEIAEKKKTASAEQARARKEKQIKKAIESASDVDYIDGVFQNHVYWNLKPAARDSLNFWIQKMRQTPVGSRFKSQQWNDAFREVMDVFKYVARVKKDPKLKEAIRTIELGLQYINGEIQSTEPSQNKETAPTAQEETIPEETEYNLNQLQDGFDDLSRKIYDRIRYSNKKSLQDDASVLVDIRHFIEIAREEEKRGNQFDVKLMLNRALLPLGKLKETNANRFRPAIDKAALMTQEDAPELISRFAKPFLGEENANKAQEIINESPEVGRLFVELFNSYARLSYDDAMAATGYTRGELNDLSYRSFGLRKWIKLREQILAILDNNGVETNETTADEGAQEAIDVEPSIETPEEAAQAVGAIADETSKPEIEESTPETTQETDSTADKQDSRDEYSQVINELRTLSRNINRYRNPQRKAEAQRRLQELKDRKEQLETESFGNSETTEDEPKATQETAEQETNAPTPEETLADDEKKPIAERMIEESRENYRQEFLDKNGEQWTEKNKNNRRELIKETENAIKALDYFVAHEDARRRESSEPYEDDYYNGRDGFLKEVEDNKNALRKIQETLEKGYEGDAIEVAEWLEGITEDLYEARNKFDLEPFTPNQVSLSDAQSERLKKRMARYKEGDPLDGVNKRAGAEDVDEYYRVMTNAEPGSFEQRNAYNKLMTALGTTPESWTDSKRRAYEDQRIKDVLKKYVPSDAPEALEADLPSNSDISKYGTVKGVIRAELDKLGYGKYFRDEFVADNPALCSAIARLLNAAQIQSAVKTFGISDEDATKRAKSLVNNRLAGLGEALKNAFIDDDWVGKTAEQDSQARHVRNLAKAERETAIKNDELDRRFKKWLADEFDIDEDDLDDMSEDDLDLNAIEHVRNIVENQKKENNAQLERMRKGFSAHTSAIENIFNGGQATGGEIDSNGRYLLDADKLAKIKSGEYTADDWWKDEQADFNKRNDYYSGLDYNEELPAIDVEDDGMTDEQAAQAIGEIEDETPDERQWSPEKGTDDEQITINGKTMSRRYFRSQVDRLKKLAKQYDQEDDAHIEFANATTNKKEKARRYREAEECREKAFNARHEAEELLRQLGEWTQKENDSIYEIDTRALEEFDPKAENKTPEEAAQAVGEIADETPGDEETAAQAVDNSAGAEENAPTTRVDVRTATSALNAISYELNEKYNKARSQSAKSKLRAALAEVSAWTNRLNDPNRSGEYADILDAAKYSFSPSGDKNKVFQKLNSVRQFLDGYDSLFQSGEDADADENVEATTTPDTENILETPEEAAQAVGEQAESAPTSATPEESAQEVGQAAESAEIPGDVAAQETAKIADEEPTAAETETETQTEEMANKSDEEPKQTPSKPSQYAKLDENDAATIDHRIGRFLKAYSERFANGETTPTETKRFLRDWLEQIGPLTFGNVKFAANALRDIGVIDKNGMMTTMGQVIAKDWSIDSPKSPSVRALMRLNFANTPLGRYYFTAAPTGVKNGEPAYYPMSKNSFVHTLQDRLGVDEKTANAAWRSLANVGSSNLGKLLGIRLNDEGYLVSRGYYHDADAFMYGLYKFGEYFDVNEFNTSWLYDGDPEYISPAVALGIDADNARAMMRGIGVKYNLTYGGYAGTHDLDYFKLSLPSGLNGKDKTSESVLREIFLGETSEDGQSEPESFDQPEPSSEPSDDGEQETLEEAPTESEETTASNESGNASIDENWEVSVFGKKNSIKAWRKRIADGKAKADEADRLVQEAKEERNKDKEDFNRKRAYEARTRAENYERELNQALKEGKATDPSLEPKKEKRPPREFATLGKKENVQKIVDQLPKGEGKKGVHLWFAVSRSGRETQTEDVFVSLDSEKDIATLLNEIDRANEFNVDWSSLGEESVWDEPVINLHAIDHESADPERTKQYIEESLPDKLKVIWSDWQEEETPTPETSEPTEKSDVLTFDEGPENESLDDNGNTPSESESTAQASKPDEADEGDQEAIDVEPTNETPEEAAMSVGNSVDAAQGDGKEPERESVETLEKRVRAYLNGDPKNKAYMGSNGHKPTPRDEHEDLAVLKSASPDSFDYRFAFNRLQATIRNTPPSWRKKDRDEWRDYHAERQIIPFRPDDAESLLSKNMRDFDVNGSRYTTVEEFIKRGLLSKAVPDEMKPIPYDVIFATLLNSNECKEALADMCTALSRKAAYFTPYGNDDDSRNAWYRLRTSLVNACLSNQTDSEPASMTPEEDAARAVSASVNEPDETEEEQEREPGAALRGLSKARREKQGKLSDTGFDKIDVDIDKTREMNAIPENERYAPYRERIQEALKGQTAEERIDALKEIRNSIPLKGGNAPWLPLYREIQSEIDKVKDESDDYVKDPLGRYVRKDATDDVSVPSLDTRRQFTSKDVELARNALQELETIEPRNDEEREQKEAKIANAKEVLRRAESERRLREGLARSRSDVENVEEESEPENTNYGNRGEDGYYPIDERRAKSAHEMNSWRDYKENEATNAYRSEVDKARKIASEKKTLLPQKYHDQIDSLLDKYERRLAEWYDKESRINTYEPSMLTGGAGRISPGRKDRQNARRAANMSDYDAINDILHKIKGLGTAGISSDDSDAVQHLKTKLESLQQLQEDMKAANAYRRKHGSWDGYDGPLADEVRRRTESSRPDFNSNFVTSFKDPHDGSFYLTSNSAEIRRIRERIEQLEKIRGANFGDDVPFDGGVVHFNKEANRIQLKFDDKPDAETISKLKSNGFKWAPREKAWQRMLNGNGIYAAKSLGYLPEDYKAKKGEEPAPTAPEPTVSEPDDQTPEDAARAVSAMADETTSPEVETPTPAPEPETASTAPEPVAEETTTAPAPIEKETASPEIDEKPNVTYEEVKDLFTGENGVDSALSFRGTEYRSHVFSPLFHTGILDKQGLGMAGAFIDDLAPKVRLDGKYKGGAKINADNLRERVIKPFARLLGIEPREGELGPSLLARMKENLESRKSRLLSGNENFNAFMNAKKERESLVAEELKKTIKEIPGADTLGEDKINEIVRDHVNSGFTEIDRGYVEDAIKEKKRISGLYEDWQKEMDAGNFPSFDDIEREDSYFFHDCNHDTACFIGSAYDQYGGRNRRDNLYATNMSRNSELLSNSASAKKAYALAHAHGQSSLKPGFYSHRALDELVRANQRRLNFKEDAPGKWTFKGGSLSYVFDPETSTTHFELQLSQAPCQATLNKLKEGYDKRFRYKDGVWRSPDIQPADKEADERDYAERFQKLGLLPIDFDFTDHCQNGELAQSKPKEENAEFETVDDSNSGIASSFISKDEKTGNGLDKYDGAYVIAGGKDIDNYNAVWRDFETPADGEEFRENNSIDSENLLGFIGMPFFRRESLEGSIERDIAVHEAKERLESFYQGARGARARKALAISYSDAANNCRGVAHMRVADELVAINQKLINFRETKPGVWKFGNMGQLEFRYFPYTGERQMTLSFGGKIRMGNSEGSFNTITTDNLRSMGWKYDKYDKTWTSPYIKNGLDLDRCIRMPLQSIGLLPYYFDYNGHCVNEPKATQDDRPTQYARMTSEDIARMVSRAVDRYYSKSV